MGVCLALAVMLVTLLSLGVTPVYAEDIFVEIPYAETPPTIDGEAGEGEYSVSYTMDSTTAEAWVGTLGRSSGVVWRFAWDDRGLYVCATVKDSTPVYRDTETHWVGADCVEFGLNPGYILDKADDKGVFFSMGATEGGRVIMYRHNYDEKLVSDDILGAATGHTQGSDTYTMEVCVPWSLILIEADCTKTDTHLDATKLTIGEDFGMGMVMASIDASDAETIGVAYKFRGTDFVTGKYLQGMLAGVGQEQETTPETQAETTPLDTTPDTQPVTEAQTTTDMGIDSSAPVDITEAETQAPVKTGGCGAVFSGVGLLVLCGACLAFCRKKHQD